jgi:hypothetical protein
MDLRERRLYYNRCKPEEALGPEDERNLDVDRFGTVRVRGINWVDRLAEPVELSTDPVLLLFSGLRGSGKSTELLRLSQRLSHPRGANLLPVYIDALEILDTAGTVDIPDIIASVVHSAEECLLRAEGKDAAQALQEGYLTRLWTWLTRTGIDPKQAEYSIPGGLKLILEMKTRPTLRQRVRSVIAAYLTAFLEDARKELNRLNDRAVRLGHAGLAVIFDSLEKLRGTSTNWGEVLDSAERVFAGGAPYLRLPVHVIYTVPPALLGRCIEHVEFIPMIKLRERDGSPYPPGIASARELIRKRVPDAALEKLLGRKAEDRLKELIMWSGGYPREIIRLLRRILEVPKPPLSKADFQRLWDELCDEYRKFVPEDAFPWLARVASEQYLAIRTEADRQVADLMLNNNAVLRYLNENDWFDLHPAVREIPGVQAALQPAPEMGFRGSPGDEGG